MSHDDIKAALEAATRQPWMLLYPGQCCEGYCIESEDGRDAVTHGIEGSVSDLDLITSAPTWLAELLAEVDALTARAEAAEQTIQRVRECAQQALEFADRTMDDNAAHYWTRVAAADILRALDGGEQHG